MADRERIIAAPHEHPDHDDKEKPWQHEHELVHTHGVPLSEKGKESRAVEALRKIADLTLGWDAIDYAQGDDRTQAINQIANEALLEISGSGIRVSGK